MIYFLHVKYNKPYCNRTIWYHIILRGIISYNLIFPIHMTTHICMIDYRANCLRYLFIFSCNYLFKSVFLLATYKSCILTAISYLQLEYRWMESIKYKMMPVALWMHCVSEYNIAMFVKNSILSCDETTKSYFIHDSCLHSSCCFSFNAPKLKVLLGSPSH